VKLADIMVKDVITITPDDNSATAAKRGSKQNHAI
jgi:hypothetical protein